MTPIEIMLYFEKQRIQMEKQLNNPLFEERYMTKQQLKITKQDINDLAAPLKFPFDHSKQEVKDIDKLFELVQVCFELEQILQRESNQKS